MIQLFQHGCSLASKRRRFFFDGILILLETSENSLNSATYDNSEFLFRWLDAHERTLSTLLSRIEQTYHGAPEIQDLNRDLRTLLNHTSNLRSHYERTFFLSMERDSDEYLPAVNHSLHRRDQGTGPGRPRLQVTREQLRTLNEDAGFSWSEISRTLGISERTLRRRRHELGMRFEGKEFSSLSDSELDNVIRRILSVTPGAGLRMVQGAVRQRRSNQTTKYFATYPDFNGSGNRRGVGIKEATSLRCLTAPCTILNLASGVTLSVWRITLSSSRLLNPAQQRWESSFMSIKSAKQKFWIVVCRRV